MTVLDVYFLAVHEPYRAPEHPVPVNATIEHVQTLLHRGIAQPDGGLMYRCLTEFPYRSPGCVVPLSTLTYELNGGSNWPRIGDWEAVVTGIVRLSRQQHCDAMPLGLPATAASLLAQGPTTEHTVYYVDAPPARVGPAHRQRQLDELTHAVRKLRRAGPVLAWQRPDEPATRAGHPAVPTLVAPQSPLTGPRGPG